MDGLRWTGPKRRPNRRLLGARGIGRPTERRHRSVASRGFAIEAHEPEKHPQCLAWTLERSMKSLPHMSLYLFPCFLQGGSIRRKGEPAGCHVRFFLLRAKVFFIRVNDGWKSGSSPAGTGTESPDLVLVPPKTLRGLARASFSY